MTNSLRLTEKAIARFWSKVDIRGDNECWLWKSYILPSGYGSISFTEKKHYAHRIAWIITNGREPRKGHEIAHAPIICHNRACCNPAHLSEKTPKQNSKDKVLDGTLNTGERHGSHTHPESVLRGEHIAGAKLTEEKVKQILLLLKQGVKQHEIASQFGIARGYVSLLEHRRRWKHLRVE